MEIFTPPKLEPLFYWNYELNYTYYNYLFIINLMHMRHKGGLNAISYSLLSHIILKIMCDRYKHRHNRF